MTPVVVAAWHNEAQRDAFLSAWGLTVVRDWLVLQHDKWREGCAVTKNKGIARAVNERQASVVVVLDDDCFPSDEAPTLPDLVAAHQAALQPAPVELFATVTEPPSRGTPYFNTTAALPVAASMGFWTDVGDYCAVRGLAFAHQPMTFARRAIYGRYFPLCGMNLAFNVRMWDP